MLEPFLASRSKTNPKRLDHFSFPENSGRSSLFRFDGLDYPCVFNCLSSFMRVERPQIYGRISRRIASQVILTAIAL